MNTPPQPSPILFLSGAGLPEWIWDDIRSELLGESVVATYPRHRDPTLRDYAVAALDQAPDGQFTIVAHSIGGIVASELVAIAPARVSGLLGVTASIPVAGASFLDSLPAPQRYLVGLIMRFAGTRPPAKAMRTGLAAGLDEATISRIVSAFEPETQHLYRDRLSPRVFPAHRGYVTTTADREFPITSQRKYAAELDPPFHHELPSGHLPMLQNPAALTKVIQEFTTSAYPN